MASGKRPELLPRPNSKTFAGKVKESASGLTRAAFVPPSTASDTLASLPNADGKGESSATAPSAGESSHQVTSSDGLHSSRGLYHARGLETFRSEQSARATSSHSVQSVYDEFVYHTGELRAEPGTDLDRQKADASQRQGTGDDAVFSDHVGAIRQSYPSQQAITEGCEQGNNDGAAVVALLSDPSFPAETQSKENWDVPKEDRYHLCSESPLGKGQAASRENDLQRKPLDLFPNFTCFGIDAEPALISPWEDILHRYHDDVWGDALPLVEEARQEIKEAAASKDRSLESRPALRRLGMLLQHMNSRMQYDGLGPNII
ncbi:MAG: hypothetical protein Q9163_003203 [Psora crenata]